MNYPLAFRPNTAVNVYTVGGVLVIANVPTQVFRPWLATANNTYAIGVTNIWQPGSTILRVVMQGLGVFWDHPGAVSEYVVFQPDFANVKWRIASGYNWQDALGPTMAFAWLGAFQ